MKVIITGGSGFIGSRLTNSLAKDGHEVVILSRTPEQVSGLPSGARAIKWDAESEKGWASEADGADAIVNLAGVNLAGKGFFPQRWTEERRRRIRSSRVNAGKAVVKAVEAVKNKPGMVLQPSAIGYYGPRGDEIVTEEGTPGDDFLAQICVDWEAVSAPVEDLGVRRVVTRTGIILHPKDGALQRLLLPFKLFVGGPFGNGEQWYSWIHIEDDIRAMRFLIENQDVSGTFNLTAPNPVKNRIFAKKLGKVLNRPSFIPTPGFALKIAFGEVTTVVLDGQRVIPKKLQEVGFEFKFPELEPAFRDLL